MSILDVPPPRSATVLSIIVAEHPRHLVRRYKPPGRVVWFTVQPSRHFRLMFLQAYKTEAAAVVTFHF